MRQYEYTYYISCTNASYSDQTGKFNANFMFNKLYIGPIGTKMKLALQTLVQFLNTK